MRVIDVRRCRRIFGILIAAALCSTGAWAEDRSRTPIQLAQAVVVPDGQFASAADYLAGTWVWETPQQTMQLRFTRNGELFFRDVTSGASAIGRYEARPDAIRTILIRTCVNEGACVDRNPPLDQTYPLQPISANEYRSANEVWRRQSRE